MKKLLIVFIITLSNGEITQTMIEDAMINGFKKAGETTLDAGESIIRRITNTRTKKQLCQSEEMKLRKKESKHWWKIWRENQKLKKILTKKRIDYNTLFKQIREEKINLVKLKNESCSESYFNYALQRKKANNEIEKKNSILKELMEANNISNEKNSLYKNISKKEKKRKKLNIIIKSKEELNEELLKAIQDVN